jgi:thiosulfate dehydrogenase
MLKGIILGVFLTIVAGAVTAYALIRTGVIPANADAKPGPLENFVARTDLRAVLGNESPKQPNPVALTDANLIAGIKLFGMHCAICHGTADRNAAPPPIAKGEYPAPPQLAKDGVEDDPEGWTFWKIKHGIRWTGMPSWKYELNDKEIWTLALFLKHMDKLPPAPQAVWQALAPPPGGTSASAAPAAPGASDAKP